MTWGQYAVGAISSDFPDISSDGNTHRIHLSDGLIRGILQSDLLLDWKAVAAVFDCNDSMGGWG